MTVSVNLVSQTTDTAAPFSFAQVFKRGDIPSSLVCVGATSYQVTILRTWSDGSVKHAMVSGFASITESTNSPTYDGTPTVLTLNPGTPPTGSNLTAADIATEAPTASIQFGAYGTISLASLLASPFKTWESGPQKVTCIYRGEVAATYLSAWFHVTMWLGGRMKITAIAEHGYLDAYEASLSYVPTITIDGSTVYNNGGASLTHYYRSAYSAEGWIGGDPGITVLHDSSYLRSTKLVPNYGWTAPPSSVFASLTTTYTQMARAGWTADMGNGGYQHQIGLLPWWDALYCTSGDIRANKAMVTASKALRSYGITMRDSSTKLAPKPTNFPTWTINGPAMGGTDQIGTGFTWEVNHHGSGGYLAYMMTGEYQHYDTLALQASAVYFVISSIRGSGVNRRIFPPQVRGISWAQRTIGQFVAIAPTGDDVALDYRTLIENDYAYWAGQGPGNSSAAQLGYPVSVGTYNPSNPLTAAPWQYSFWIGVNGHLSDAELGLTSTANQIAHRDWMYKAVVGLLGPTGTSNFYYTKASTYNIRISTEIVADYGERGPNNFYATWGDVYQATFGVGNTETSSVLTDDVGDLDPYSYWANLTPAIAFAVDHGATGAAAAYARLTGASNYSTLRDSGFDSVPVWGVVPRFATHTSSSGPTTRASSSSLISGKTVAGNRGLGVLASTVPSTGLSGASFLYNDLTLPADNSKEVYGLILTVPSAGTFYAYEDGSFSLIGAPDGTYTFTYRLFVNGVDSGTATAVITVGAGVGFKSFLGIFANQYIQG